ncbi:ATP-grasp domain-containing protein [Flagellimonas taeanensis]|uniref:ATP-grasp domain-containing protein n=1 Tax=Flavobacteriaceae TaxID=49546 RepID=UPI000E68B9CD|nr:MULTISPECIES: ATP-grasp domain-containing protein [Allomuricauda]MDC6385750.1 ATP-grasp domain-containing protein [Muricauda sp. SK9]MEE1963179.1 ATP-grasp domain-containing protein [Allomuricauda taeanensis]RIV50962.1 ATP-grasp domain-containing protein [Allomuricauda taeanensis]
MKKTNILFTCAGRRNYLINYFKEALQGNGLVLAADSQLSAPALVDADVAIQVPSIYSPEYIEKLKELIQDHDINAIISLNDLELPLLSKNREELEKLGTKVIISNPQVIDIAFDKWKTFSFFKETGVETPKTYITLADAQNALSKGELEYPLVIKPRWGSASIAIDIVENEEELQLAYQLQRIKIQKSILRDASSEDMEKSILIQEKINGDEYGIDILNDFEGNHYGSFIRKKMGMRSGETDKAISVINKDFSKIAKTIAEKTKHIGNMDCDFFVSNGKVYYLEMNPRFGGGYPFSHEAGINTPAIYISWLNGESSVDRHNHFTEGLMFSKCDRLMPIKKW